MIIVDAHEDLAWNALTFKRDYMRSVHETRERERGTQIPTWNNGQALIGYPEWIEGRVGVVFSTLFASPQHLNEGAWDSEIYQDVESAHACYLADLAYYRRLFESHPDKLASIQSRGDLDGVLAGWESEGTEAAKVGMVLLMEGADGVRTPGEVGWWYEAGVRILGPAWSRTRYAGGTGDPGPLTDLGRELLRSMETCGMILDLSHLSQEGTIEALELYDSPIIASHISPLSMVPTKPKPERHFSDELIRLCGEREVVMGLVLANEFLLDNWTPEMGREAASLEIVADGIDRICQSLGTSKLAGIGSDFDGGFGLERVPSGLDSVADLVLIGGTLLHRGYSQQDVDAVLGGNWLRVLQQSLPES
jgi:membrane dipeptidase